MRKEVYKRDELICCYCEELCAIGNVSNGASLDHVIPQRELALSTENDREFFKARKNPKNIVVACRACNSSKQHLPLIVWCKNTGKDYDRIIAEIDRRTSKET